MTIVLFNEGLHTVAQCLEYDIAAQGADVSSALREWARLWDLRLEEAKRRGVGPFAGLQPAPGYYWDMVPHTRPLL